MFFFHTDDYRFIMFVKLFFGMGFLWIFEIIAAICENDDNDQGYFWWVKYWGLYISLCLLIHPTYNSCDMEIHSCFQLENACQNELIS